jgi:hypothetical protein
MYVFTAGIDIEVPDSFRDEVAPWHTNPSATELKYYYITTIVPSAEYDPLTNAIMGQSAPTEAGIADATAGFPNNGERSGN